MAESEVAKKQRFTYWAEHPIVVTLGALATAVTLIGFGMSISNSSSGDGTQPEPTAAGPTTSCEDSTEEQIIVGIVASDQRLLGSASRILAARIAAEEINDAGGVSDRDICLIEPPPGGANTNIEQTATDLVNKNVDAIMAIGESQLTLDLLELDVLRDTIVFSPNNTSTELTFTGDEELFFRTSPSDAMQGRVLSDELLGSGIKTASVVYIDDGYGSSLWREFLLHFETDDRRVLGSIPFTSNTLNPKEIASQLVTDDAEAIIVIGYAAESAQILIEMHNQGVGPTSDVDVWGVDGNLDLNDEVEDAELRYLEGFKQTYPFKAPNTVQSLMLKERVEEGTSARGFDYEFVPETYDALMILALAFVETEEETPRSILESVDGITAGDVTCDDYEACISLIADGVDADYVGVGGDYEFRRHEPSEAEYRIDTYGTNGPQPSQEEYVSASLCFACEVNSLPAIEFAEGSSTISDSSRSSLNRIARVLRGPDIGVVEIQGFASPEGSPEANRILSQERAQSVYNYLVESAGVSPDKLSQPVGFGSTDKLPQNRVVVFREIG